MEKDTNMSCALSNHPRASRGRQFSALVLRAALRVALCAGAILFVATACDQYASAQLRVGKSRIRGQRNNGTTVFTGATRQLLRPLRLAEVAIETEDFDKETTTSSRIALFPTKRNGDMQSACGKRR